MHLKSLRIEETVYEISGENGGSVACGLAWSLRYVRMLVGERLACGLATNDHQGDAGKSSPTVLTLFCPLGSMLLPDFMLQDGLQVV